jgi:hypothetical protein
MRKVLKAALLVLFGIVLAVGLGTMMFWLTGWAPL